MLLRGFVPRILFAVQVRAGRGNGRVAEIVSYKPQFHLLVGRVRARRMTPIS